MKHQVQNYEFLSGKNHIDHALMVDYQKPGSVRVIFISPTYDIK